MRLRHEVSVTGWGPFVIEGASRLYAATIPIGTTKKTTSQTTGRLSKVGAVRSSRSRRRPAGLAVDARASASLVMARTGGYRSGGLHSFPHLRVDIPPGDVAVDVRVPGPEGVRIVELESAQEVARRRLREKVRVTVAVVVLQPLPACGR